jgi:hypothetical protein
MVALRCYGVYDIKCITEVAGHLATQHVRSYRELVWYGRERQHEDMRMRTLYMPDQCVRIPAQLKPPSGHQMLGGALQTSWATLSRYRCKQQQQPALM